MMNIASARFAVSESALFRDLELSMSSHASTARAYARAQNERFLRELLEFLRIPSLSGSPDKAADVAQAADWLAANMRVSAFVFLYRVLRQRISPSEAERDLHAIWQPDEVWSRFIRDRLENE